MPSYLAYQKRMQSRRRLTIRGTDAEVEDTRTKLCSWLEQDVAACLPFLLPPPSDKARRAVALANLRAVPLLDLLYMIATLQEAWGVPPFPCKMQACQVLPAYRPPTQAMLDAVNSFPPFLAVVPSREPGAGLGIVNASKDRIPAGELLGYYTGMVMTVAQGERLAWKKNNRYILFVRGPDKKRTHCINARNRITSSWARFVNEARGGTKPNIIFSSRYDAVELVTTKAIKPGEEILATYR